MNFSKLGNKKWALWTLLIGFGYSFLQFTLLTLFNIPISGIGLLLSLLGMWLIEHFIWEKQVPRSLAFTNRSIWNPIVMAVLLWFSVAISIVVAGKL